MKRYGGAFLLALCSVYFGWRCVACMSNALTWLGDHNGG